MWSLSFKKKTCLSDARAALLQGHDQGRLLSVFPLAISAWLLTAHDLLIMLLNLIRCQLALYYAIV